MSKMAFSFGLKKSGPSKPAPVKRKPATFGGGFDNEDEDDHTVEAGDNPTKVEEISVLGAFGDDNDNDDKKLARRRRPVSPKPLARKRTTGPANPSAPTKTPPTLSKARLGVPVSQLGDLSSALEARRHAEAAERDDPSVYDYDAAYDAFKSAARDKKKKKEKGEEAEEEEVEGGDEDGEGGKGQRPRYFGALLRAAEQRERDRQVAEEKRLRREREAEGDAFADKETFVTEAYRRQQAENRRLEEEEEAREAREREANGSKGMVNFYRRILDRGEEEHAAMVRAAEERARGGGGVAKDAKDTKVEGGEEEEEVQGDDDEKAQAEQAREINARGGHVTVNDEGEVVDKRELLQGGLNVSVRKKAELEKDRRRKQEAAARGGGGGKRGIFNIAGGRQAMRERQTRMLEEQLAETLKRSREEEEAERQRVEVAAKSRKTEANVSSAKERYLARKRAAEEAKKNGTEEVP